MGNGEWGMGNGWMREGVESQRDPTPSIHSHSYSLFPIPHPYAVTLPNNRLSR